MIFIYLDQLHRYESKKKSYINYESKKRLNAMIMDHL